MAKNLRPITPTHFVHHFDSCTMKNRVSLCRIVKINLSTEMADVQIYQPVRKRLRVPLDCLTCRYTGFRLGGSDED